MTIKTIFFFFLIGIASYKGQQSNQHVQIVDSNTGFKMNLPKGFEELSKNESDKMYTDGKKRIDKLYNTDIDVSNLKPKMFRLDDNNYFILSIQDYDPTIDGDYWKEVDKMNELLYQTYMKNFQPSRIDSLNQKMKIDNIEFTKHSLFVHIPPSLNMKVINYTSFINQKDLTIGVVYIDDKIGDEVIKAIENARFEK